MNGEQLYGFKRLKATMEMSSHPVLKALSIRKKLGLNYIARENKLTRLGNKIYSNTFTPHYPSKAYDRFLEGAVETAAGNPRPVITNFAVTARCICNCWHCSFSNRDLADSMTLTDYRTQIGRVQDMGVSVIGITGGEPLLRKDLEEIIACIDDRSIPLLFTTGHGINRARVKELKDAGLEIPVLSLDHYTKEHHDKGRGREGVFDQTVKAIEMFMEEGFYTAVSFVPTKALVDDEKDLFKTLDFFKSLGINDMRLTSPILSGQLVTRAEEKLSPDNIKTIFKFRKKAKKKKGYPNVFAYDFFESKQYYGCGAGYNYMFIDSEGHVSPCDFTMLSFGNIKEKPVSEIWQEMSSHFKGPSCSCYANVIHDSVAALGSDKWPVPPETSKKILQKHPPYNKFEIPRYYRKMKFGKS